MNSDLIKQKYYEFWRNSPRNCKEIPNVSLVPNNDSTLLFVNSGMFPLAPYLAGEKHPLGTRLFNFQRCLRPKYEEILEIGDNRHVILFEMMGDWSLGDFDKTEQIPWILQLYVEEFGLDPLRIYVSVFGGDEDVPRDELAIETWKKAFLKYNVEAEFSENNNDIPANLEAGKTHKPRIFPYNKKKNWWQRGEVAGELGGPCSEIFYDLGQIEKPDTDYHINDDSGRFVEIGNNVFMEFSLDENLKWQKLKQKNIDFGGGFERIVMCLQEKTDIFETDLFSNTLDAISKISNKPYKTDGKVNDYTSSFRVIADHARASAFIISDGIKPSNKDQGYILRRFIRRMIRFGRRLGIENHFAGIVVKSIIERFKTTYPMLEENASVIISTIEQEEIAFSKTLIKGLKEIEKIKSNSEKITGKDIFQIYETFGFPIEMAIEELGFKDQKADALLQEFKIVENEHKAKSRAGAEQKFKGGLADQSKEVIKLHTAHHLLLKALQEVIDASIKQRGSNITGERLRIDFNYDKKLEPEQIKTVEDYVNSAIKNSYNVIRLDMPKSEAEKIGAQMEFGQKYPEIVSVYKIVDANNSVISLEFCGGPHVKNTSEIGENSKLFKITDQENIGGGLRRIKAKLQ